MNFLAKLFISTFAVLITSYFLDGVTISNNQFLTVDAPEINKFITAFLFADKLVDGFKVDGFWTALWFSLVLSLVSGILEMFSGNKKEKE